MPWTKSHFRDIDLKSFAFREKIVIRIPSLLWLLALLFCVPAPSVAQVPTSTQDIIPSSSRPQRSDIRRSDAVFRDLVACVVRYQPERARNLLETIPGTYAEGDILVTFRPRMETCFDYPRLGGRALGFDWRLLRGAIAETAFAIEFPEGIAAAAAPAEALAAWARPREADGQVTTLELVHAMARCVTLRQPAEVNRLLRAEPLGAEERAAMRRLQPDLAACLDSGVNFTASRQALRALLAEAALQYAEASRDGFARVARVDPPAAD